MPLLVIVLIENCNLFMFESKVVIEKVKRMLQWKWVTYREIMDSQWQKVNQEIPQ